MRQKQPARAMSAAATMPDKKKNKSELCSNIFRLSDMKNNRRHGWKKVKSPDSTMCTCLTEFGLCGKASFFIFRIVCALPKKVTVFSRGFSPENRTSTPFSFTFYVSVGASFSFVTPVVGIRMCALQKWMEMKWMVNSKQEITVEHKHFFYIFNKYFRFCRKQMFVFLPSFHFVCVMRLTIANPYEFHIISHTGLSFQNCFPSFIAKTGGVSHVLLLFFFLFSSFSFR